jgi:hypothetical protein
MAIAIDGNHTIDVRVQVRTSSPITTGGLVS